MTLCALLSLVVKNKLKELDPPNLSLLSLLYSTQQLLECILN